MTAGRAERRRVLVLGSDTRSFLTVVRSLGRAGLSVDIAWCDPTCIAARSRYVSAVHDLPRYSPALSDWKTALRDLLTQYAFALVVPCDDPSILPLQANRAEFEGLAPLYLLDDRAFRITADKQLTQALAQQCSVPVPRSVTATDHEGALIASRSFGFPLIVKPTSSFTLDNVRSKRSVRTARSEAELNEVIERLGPGESALLQEFIGGVGAGVEVLARHGQILLAFQHVRVHEPLRGGGSSYRRSAAPDPRLLEAAHRLIRALDYTGVAMVEFRVDDRSGRWVLLEINGRFWGSLPLAVAAGCDFPRYLFEMLVDGRTVFPMSYREGLFARNWSEDIHWFAERVTIATRRREILSDLAGAAMNVVAGRERSDTLVLDDPLPGLLELKVLAHECASAGGRQIRKAVRRTAFVRRREKQRLLSALRRSRNLLFLCKGNICRSAFAEHYAKRVLPENYNVRSAGHLRLEGRRSPQTALDAARHFGVDLSNHRSCIVTGEMIDAADAILAFDDEQTAAIRELFPRARHKAYLLGVLESGGDSMIPDPYGHQEAEFVKVFSRIAGNIHSFPGAATASQVEAFGTQQATNTPVVAEGTTLDT